MAHNSDYTKIWDPYGHNNGLSFDEIARCIGSASLNIRDLCSSQNINKWALYKPQALEPHPNFWGILDMDWRKDDNFGFDLSDKFVNQSNPIALLSLSNYDWSYKPRIAPFRTLDFSAINGIGEENGYKHNAVCPFDADPGTTLIGSGGPFQINARYSQSADIDLSQLNVITQEGGDWHLAFVYKQGGSDDIHVAHGPDIQFFVTHSEDAVVEINLTAGDNDGVWVFTTLPEDDGEYEMYKYLALPNGFRRYRVDPSPYIGYVWVSLVGNVMPHSTGGDLDYVDMLYEISNNSENDDSTVSLKLEFAYLQGGTYDTDVISPIERNYGPFEPGYLEHITLRLDSEQWGAETIDFDKIYIKGSFTSYTSDHGTVNFYMKFTGDRNPTTVEQGWVQLSSLV